MFLDESTGGFVRYTRASSNISALVGTDTNARIFRNAARQGAPVPYLVYTHAPGGTQERSLQGATTVRQLKLHVYCYAETTDQAELLAKHVRDRWANVRGDTDTASVWVYRSTADIWDDGYDASTEGSDRKRYWVRVMIGLTIRE